MHDAAAYHGLDREAVWSGATTDIYFERAKRILDAEGLADVPVVAEVTAGSLGASRDWAVLAGLDEALALLASLDDRLVVHSVPEGTVFRSRDDAGVPLPLLTIEGPYGAFATAETALLGFLCQASGTATEAARFRFAVPDARLLSFGARRAHPALAGVIDRAAFIGGCDGVSTLAGARAIGRQASGTIPHALVLVMGGLTPALLAFDKVIEPDVARVALIDTLDDERTEALAAAEALGERLQAVRLDTHASRRGSLARIAQEVRWELDRRGFDDVELYASGGLDVDTVVELARAGVTGFGVGTALSSAPSVDLALDLVEVDGQPRAKRGKFPGRKQLGRCDACFADSVHPSGVDARCRRCGADLMSISELAVSNATVRVDAASPERARQHVLEQLARLGEDGPG